MSLKYDIEVAYIESGNLGGKIGNIGAKLKDLHGDFNGLGSALSSGFSGALDVVSDVAKTIAGIGVAGVAGIAVAGGAIVHMNDQLEGTQIALASIFRANGASSTFAAGMGLAATQIGKMRKDAADLPGEFDDLVNIFQTIAPNTFRGGMGADGTRQLAAQTMAAAAIMKLPMHVAAREMSALIEGRAGAHNILGLRMMGLAGNKAKDFNHLSEEERLKKLSGAMSNLVTPDVLTAFQHSFTGLFSTAKQNFKTLAMTFGNPLFESTKGALEKINNWFAANQPMIDAYAHYLGQKLANAFEYGVSWFQQYGPAIWDFATNAAVKLHDVWLKMEPVVARIGTSIRSFLQDPKALDKLGLIAKLGLGARIAAPMIQSVGGSMLSGGLGAGGGSLEGLLGISTAGLAASGALAALAIAVIGTKSALDEQGSVLHGFVASMMEPLKADFASAGQSFKNAGSSMEQAISASVQIIGTVLMAQFGPVISSAAKGLGKAVEFSADGQALLGNFLLTGNRVITTGADHDRSKNPSLLKGLDTGEDRRDKLKTPPVSNTNIQKVEIVVQSNQDPSRIARLTVQEMLKVKGNTRTGFIPKMLGGTQ